MGKRNLIHFLKNLIDVTLKFSYKSRETSIPFFDLKVSLSNRDLSTDLHITDRHQFLYYTSSILIILNATIYSQDLRSSRVCPNKSDFLKHLESMKSWFEARGYPKKLIEQEIFAVYE